MARLARKIPTLRSYPHNYPRPRGSLRPFHDDLSTKDRHNRPAFEILALPDRPSSRAVDHVSLHLGRALEIDNDKIGIRTNADHSLFRIEAENARRIFTTDLDQLFQRNFSFMDILRSASQASKPPRGKESRCWFPTRCLYPSAPRHSPINVVRADAIGCAPPGELPTAQPWWLRREAER